LIFLFGRDPTNSKDEETVARLHATWQNLPYPFSLRDRFCIVYFALDHMYLIRRAVGGKAWRGQECRGLLAPWRAESFNLEEYLKKRLLDLDDRTQLIAKLHEAFRTQDGPVTSFKFT
jgi:hypothetical protein